MTATQAPPTYSSAEVCRQTGLPYDVLNRWAVAGHLRPRWRDKYGRPAKHGGSGYDRVWSQKEVDRAIMMAHLVTLGVTAQQAAKVARDPDTLERWVAAVVAAVFPG